MKKFRKITMLGGIALASVCLASCGAKVKSSTQASPTSEQTPTTSDVPTTSIGSTTSEIPTTTTAQVPTTTETQTPTLNPEDGTYLEMAALNPNYSSDTSSAVLELDSIDTSSKILSEEVEDTGSLSYGSATQTAGKDNIQVSSMNGLLESAYAEFTNIAGATDYAVYIEGGSWASKTKLDKKNVYVRIDSSTKKVRIDLMGIPAGTYSVTIVPVISGIEGTLASGATISYEIKSYDRSGYAHFKNTEGVGAYNDDGSLKDNALVIYVTEENKDTVMSDLVSSGEIDASLMFNIPNELNLNSWGEKEAAGIGWWLNNAQYTKATKNTSGAIVPLKSSTTYSSSGVNLGMRAITETTPVVIRFVGTVTTPEGLTAYDSYGEGGSEGDNGHMARMKDLRNITLEGVGTDSVIEGWGFHFMASDRTGAYGKNFEARNLTFKDYPEDALGMEGVQETAKGIVAPVQRCWIHNCTFFPGFCANPAESDKAEGDGACDFKRGYYYTLSYCYFEYAHKTSLVGSSDTSLQYNISMHHNFYYNCGSRMTLTRQANIHFYNNYFYVDITDPDAQPSYITSLRANCYMFAENNYYEGCKQVFQEKNGRAKCYGNTYNSCFSTTFSSAAVNVDSRTEAITNKCLDTTTGIDYSTFDTNSSLFYYDATKQKSDCYITSSTIARNECIVFSGSYFRTLAGGTSRNTATTAAKNTTSKTVQLTNNELTVAIPTSKGSSETNGVYFTNLTGPGKFKSQGITFTLAETTVLNITMVGSGGLYPGQVVRADGKVMLSGSGSVILKAGTYFVTSTAFDKETTVSAMSFKLYDAEAFKNSLIASYNEAYANIPATLEVTASCYNKIAAACSLYHALGEYKTSLSTNPYDKLTAYVALALKNTEDKIAAIGTVTEDSGALINEAESTYNFLMAISPTTAVSNLSVLESSKDIYQNYAVDKFVSDVAAITKVDPSAKQAIEAALVLYDNLTEDQQEDSKVKEAYSKLDKIVASYNEMLAGVTVNNAIYSASLKDKDALKACMNSYNALTVGQKAYVSNTQKYNAIQISYVQLLIDAIPETVTMADRTDIEEAKALYESFTEDQKAYITSYDKVAKALEQIAELLKQAHSMDFLDNNLVDENGFFTISGSASTSNGKGTITYNGTEYNICLKTSSKAEVSFTLESTMTLTLVMKSGQAICIDGKETATDENGIITITLEAGTHKVIKGSASEGTLFFIQVQ